MKILLFGLIVGLFFGFGGGIFTDGDFHPDFFVISALLTYLILLLIEIRRSKAKDLSYATNKTKKVG
ncbi:hypothetical protein [Salirhabdus sp. Marseille-P4669]|uniref:hypothetical protein n=1 Tax=Salirhabdus sp. Marseille-P4669 TaxID=2042310 RepID=UPI000C79FEE3|nr:hypothetical protein [Salirhabdus sp. Marseille-P4669]